VTRLLICIINCLSASLLGINDVLVLWTLTRGDRWRVGLITVNINAVRCVICIFRATLRTEPVTALFETLRYCALTVYQIRRTHFSCPFACSAPCSHHASWSQQNVAAAVRATDRISTARVPLAWTWVFFSGCCGLTVSSRRAVVGSQLNSFNTRLMLGLMSWQQLGQRASNNWITNSMVWVRERTIPTERPPLVGEVIANFCW
jgi:hypothetical protein